MRDSVGGLVRPPALRALHPSEMKVASRSHAKVHLTTTMQHSLRDTDRRGNLGRTHIFVRSLLKQHLEPNHDFLISTLHRVFYHDRISGHAFNQGADYLLVKTMRGFPAY